MYGSITSHRKISFIVFCLEKRILHFQQVLLSHLRRRRANEYDYEISTFLHNNISVEWDTCFINII